MTKDKINIVGFIHVCMIGDYIDILAEQISLITASGLYEVVNCVNICCLGEETEYEKVKTLISGYGKLQLGPYSPDIKLFEYHSLRYLKKVCDGSGNFLGFYVHSKGVSWPGSEGGKYWRDYMNYYNITQWKECYKMLRIGYELCGVKLLNKGWPLHYSGNFWWFNSEYIKTVMPVNRMNLKDRFNAEIWSCSGKPIAATLCQDFVDYNTKGIFKPPELCGCPDK